MYSNLYFISAIEIFIKVTPQYINIKMDDGCTTLHLAALNGNIYVVNALAAVVSYVLVNVHYTNVARETQTQTAPQLELTMWRRRRLVHLKRTFIKERGVSEFQ